jgi:uncharacterized membrane protein YdbT with pleckstrin-like domain
MQYQENQNKQFQIIRPNIKKIYLRNLFSIIGAVLLIIILLWITNILVGLDVFLVPFETFGDAPTQFEILFYPTLVIVGIILYLLIGNYLVNINVRYEFHEDKIIAYENVLLVFINSKEIPYQNIVRVSYNNNSIFNKIFNSGTIVLELSGMKEDKIKIEFIDNAKEIIQDIQNRICKFNSTR